MPQPTGPHIGVFCESCWPSLPHRSSRSLYLALILGEEHGVATHAARHLGAFGVAYGVALFVVVARPARARSILPVALVLAGAQVLGAIVDLATGRIPLVGEVRHLPQIISVFLIWFLAVRSTRHGDAVAEPTGPPRLKIVDGKRQAG